MLAVRPTFPFKVSSASSAVTEGCSLQDFTSATFSFCAFYTKKDVVKMLLELRPNLLALVSLRRYVAASCATEQVPSCLRSGPEERPVLRWYPRLQGHMGQLLLRRQPQVCCHHHRCQRGRSIPRTSSTKGQMLCGSPSRREKALVWFLDPLQKNCKDQICPTY